MTRNEPEHSPNDATLPAVRRADILRLIKQLGQITVTEMSSRFEVSLDTIRRDLDTLADQGLISRIHGGAVPIDSMASADSPFEQRINAHQTAKTNIGRAAARLISSGQTLIVNGGSTAVAFAASLGDLQQLTIVTNNLSLPVAIPAGAVKSLYLLGGEIRIGARVTLGPVGFVNTRQIVAAPGLAPPGRQRLGVFGLGRLPERRRKAPVQLALHHGQHAAEALQGQPGEGEEEVAQGGGLGARRGGG